MIISTIVVLLTKGGGENGGAPPKNKLVEWFKGQLEALHPTALKCLAGKAVAALPGIIGSCLWSSP